MFVQDSTFGTIVDFNNLRQKMRLVYDRLYPKFNMLGAMRLATDLFDDEPSNIIAGGASMLSYMLLLAAEEHEMAASLKGSVFTLGWTEEHCGSDLLSVRTQATPLSDAPGERQYHVRGSKWLINNSFHADYHIVVAKIDPSQNGPRSLSLFLVPQSSARNWERLKTHTLENMVLTKFEIDGPGTLIGKPGHGLTVIQRMAMPSKYLCTYSGLRMLQKALPQTLKHLNTKNIFGNNPIRFSNVFRQLYNLALQAALMEFMFYRAIVFNEGSFLQFHGTLLKSFLLLRINELLGQNLLIAGSKGFLKESFIGKAAIDSFVLPVFDGHYTINTFMSAKHLPRYLADNPPGDLNARLELLRRDLYVETLHEEINARPSDIRKPDFFDWADYIEQMNPPLELQPRQIVTLAREIDTEITYRGWSADPEYRYKTGDLIHWMEALLAACELWKLTADDNYLNLIVQQYNRLGQYINTVISEGGLPQPFMQPLRQLPLPEDIADPHAFLTRLMHVEPQVREETRHALSSNGQLALGH